MRTMPTSLDVSMMLQEAKTLTYKKDGSGALMHCSQSRRVLLPLMLERAVAEIVRIRKWPSLYVMINVLPAGIVVPTHTDRLERNHTIERWHLALETNVDCRLWTEEAGERTLEAGWWLGPFPYWRSHSVWNVGTTPRTHLIVDLDSPEVK